MDRTTSIVLILALGLAVVGAGCTSSQQAAPTGAETGKITVSGAFALYPMMVTWAEEYKKVKPGIQVEVSAGGAGKGMTDALAGMVDLGMVSRDISPEEVSKGAVWVAVTKDAVVVTANKDNPVLADLQARGVKRSEFTAIFVNETITGWGNLVGKPEITGKIDVYTRSDACGAADVWAKYMGYRQEDLKGIGVFGDPGLADAVRMDRLGIGYNNIGFAYDANTSRPIEGLAIIPLDVNGDGRLDADEQFYGTKDQILAAINTGKYPSPPARELNLVAKEKFTGATLDFVRWILTDGQQYVPEAGYIALPKERIDEQLKKLGTVQA
jgi:phosphate transport system substrate-binding protein